jgi:hypothetical protein
MMRLAIAIGVLVLLCGCGIFPHAVQEPQIHNPFPQLTKVAVAPFFNLSSEPTVDGRQFGEAYFEALQSIPGFEVVPVGVVEKAAQSHGIQLNGPEQARQLAQILGVDALVIGAVTEYSPYYPPRCGMQVEWYTANPGFHPVPPGYGLPWGTKEEEFIPPSLKLEAEMALAREQLMTQTPQPPNPTLMPNPAQHAQSREALVLPAVAAAPAAVLRPPATKKDESSRRDDSQQSQQEAIAGQPQNAVGMPANQQGRSGAFPAQNNASGTTLASANSPANVGGNASGNGAGSGAANGAGNAATAQSDANSPPVDSYGVNANFPSDWPDPRGFVPPPPSPVRPPFVLSNEPVLRHAKVYIGNDADFTTALENFNYTRDDARKDSWRGTLQRTDDFIRFCCYKNIAEMLTARGGAGESKVVYRWETVR